MVQPKWFIFHSTSVYGMTRDLSLLVSVAGHGVIEEPILIVELKK